MKRTEDELPPIPRVDVEDIWRRMADVRVVLVGGQALNFWAERYASTEPELELHRPFTSKDVDFQTTRAGVEECAAKIGVSPDFSVGKAFGSVLEAIIKIRDGGGHERTIDFLRRVEGLETFEALDTSVPVRVDGANVLVMNPVLCLVSRAANVIRLSAHYDNPHGRTQLAASIICARAFIRDAAQSGEARLALRWTERAFKLCRSAVGRRLFTEKGIDLLAAIPAESLPDEFRTRRYPQMVTQVTHQRRRGPKR